MRLNTNISSLAAQNALFSNSYALRSSIEKLSTGKRINRASNDAAGLAVSEKLRAQARGLSVASNNSQYAMSALQIADGGLNEVNSILQRMRELSVQSSSDTISSTQRGLLDKEFKQLSSEIDNIIGSTNYNNVNMLDGSWSSKELQIGPNNTSENRLAVTIEAMSASNLGVSALSIDQAADSKSAISTIDSAIGSVNSSRGSIGAYVNRLEHSVENLNNSVFNVKAAESLIRDTDIGYEMSIFIRTQILTMSSTAMLAHANAQPSYIASIMR